MKTFQIRNKKGFYGKALFLSKVNSGSLAFLMLFELVGLRLNAQPVITSFSPTSGPVGTSVLISGANFSATPSGNIVFFGATKAVVNSATPTGLNVSVPGGSTYKYFSVTSLESNLTAYSSKPFDVTYNSCGVFDQNSYAPKADIPGGNYPGDLSINDFDSDGKADIILTSWSDTLFSIYKNISSAGNISFAPKKDFSSGSYPGNIVVSDFDGDGRPDFAITRDYEAGTPVSIFRNTSSAGIISFAPGVHFAAGYRPLHMASGDFDMDGKPDLVLTFMYTTGIYVLKNVSSAGNISFTAGFNPGYGGSGDLAVCDFNGDEKPDLAITDVNTGMVTILSNTGTPGQISFNSGNSYLTGEHPYSITTCDLDGDGKSDITTTSATFPYSISVFKNTSTTGNISFAPRVDFSSGYSEFVSCADIDGNGSPDLAVLNYTGNSVSVLPNTSVPGNISFAPEVTFETGTNPRCMSVADLDDDGRPDMVIANEYANSVSILKNHRIPPAPEICMVTVDSASAHNIIYWDKTQYNNVDSFMVYRETTSDIYKRIGAVAADAPGFFTDTVRQLWFPFTGNPNVGSYRYKLQVRDTCGNLSEPGPYHNTIFIANIGSSFSWNDYKIEGQPVPVPQLLSYRLYRDNYANGNWTLVAAVSSYQTTINDPDYAAWPKALRRVVAEWSTGCSFKVTGTTVNSNIAGLIPDGISENNKAAGISMSISPNPFTDKAIVKINRNLTNAVLTMYNTNGKQVRQMKRIQGQEVTLLREYLPCGLYFLQFMQENKVIGSAKLVVND